MITSKLQKALNDQISAELWSSNLYLQMSYFLKSQGWDGYANWLRKHAEEEREHATRMADYMTDRGGAVKLQMINVVPEGWGSVLEIFEHSYEQERMVSNMIDKIVALAIGENDPEYLAAVALAANLLLDTNFFFLMESGGTNNPLYLFEVLLGDHRLGFPILVAAVLAVMFIPIEVYHKLKQKKAAVQ